MYIFQVFLTLALSFALAASLPAPQTSDIEDKIDSFNDDEDDDYYGDYDEVSAAVTPIEDKALEDLLKLGAGLAEGFLALLGEKVKFINGLLADKVCIVYVMQTVSIEFLKMQIQSENLVKYAKLVRMGSLSKFRLPDKDWIKTSFFTSQWV